jgi:hypothetical protein
MSLYDLPKDILIKMLLTLQQDAVADYKRSKEYKEDVSNIFWFKSDSDSWSQCFACYGLTLFERDHLLKKNTVVFSNVKNHDVYYICDHCQAKYCSECLSSDKHCCQECQKLMMNEFQ